MGPPAVQKKEIAVPQRDRWAHRVQAFDFSVHDLGAGEDGSRAGGFGSADASQ